MLVQLGNRRRFENFHVRGVMLSGILNRLVSSGKTLPEAILDRDLYFRVSVVGHCNLSCAFCHNEGAPVEGRLALEQAELAIAAAAKVGFQRVQFTGGEPLLRADISDFDRMAKMHVGDVGVTTNGTFLSRHLQGLVAAGVDKIHVSLQTESLIEAGVDGAWGVPDWLQPTLDCSRTGAFSLRLNLPVPAADLAAAEAFLELMRPTRADVKVFSVLPEGEVRGDDYPFALLEDLVRRVDSRRGDGGRVFLRGYRPPTGIRCPDCRDRDRCKEQSHSLRLGSDLILRPCLATRTWDSHLDEPYEESIREAALFALDYEWLKVESADAR